MPEYKLERWFFKKEPISPYQAPELWPLALAGHVFGHPKFKDDTIISSSRIISVDTDNMRVKTVHSLYILGEPNPNWIEIFPDYMKVFDNFTKETLK